MASIIIDLPDTALDQEAVATILETVCFELRNSDDITDREQMDGSIRVDTEHGPAFVTLQDDEN